MKNTASEVTIYKTKDYDRFSVITGNRIINKRRVTKIAGVVKNGVDMLPYVPVVVDEGYNIIDGQHRYFVSKELKRNVYYVIRPRVQIQDIATINSNTDKWSQKDFLNCYIKLDVGDYKVLANFIEINSFIPLAGAIGLLNSYSHRSFGVLNMAFKEGKFKVNFLEESNVMANIIKSMVPYVTSINRTLLGSMITLVKAGKYSHTTLLGKLNSSGEKLRSFDNIKDCLLEIEAIYNKNNHTRKVIY